MSDRASQSFGQYIWQARRQKRLSQRELASKVGVDYTYLSKLENDHVEPSEKVIRLLAKHLELNPEELMYLAGKISQSDSEAFEEFIKMNYKEMPALFRRVRENPGIDSLVKVRDEQISILQRENAALKAKVSELEKQLRVYRFYSKDEIEHSAYKILKDMKAIPHFAPRWPLDITCVADFIHLRIRWANSQPDDEGPKVAKILPQEREILIDRDFAELSGAYKQSIIAHQIGHWILHINPYQADGLVKQLKWKPDMVEPLPSFFCRSINEKLDEYRAGSKRDLIEWQAQYFASCLLMPQCKLEELTRELDLSKWRHLYAMRDELGVPISHLTYRLQDLGWITIPKGSRQIYIRKTEPDEQED